MKKNILNYFTRMTQSPQEDRIFSMSIQRMEPYPFITIHAHNGSYFVREKLASGQGQPTNSGARYKKRIRDVKTGEVGTVVLGYKYKVSGYDKNNNHLFTLKKLASSVLQLQQNRGQASYSQG